MARKRFSVEQIIDKLREAEVLQAQGRTVPDLSKELEISEQTLYRWRREYGGLKVNQARRLKQLELENTRLKKLVADQALDMSILREAARGNS
jgi:putative transposase